MPSLRRGLRRRADAPNWPSGDRIPRSPGAAAKVHHSERRQCDSRGEQVQWPESSSGKGHQRGVNVGKRPGNGDANTGKTETDCGWETSRPGPRCQARLTERARGAQGSEMPSNNPGQQIDQPSCFCLPPTGSNPLQTGWTSRTRRGTPEADRMGNADLDRLEPTGRPCDWQAWVRTPMAHRALVRAADAVPCRASGRHRIMALSEAEGQLFSPLFSRMFEDSPGKW